MNKETKKIKKSDIDLDTTLLELSFIMKGKGQVITVYTTATESCNFVDWLNNNPALNSYKKSDKEKFTNKFYTFMDYKARCSVTINLQDIKAFSIPFFVDDGELLEAKVLTFR